MKVFLEQTYLLDKDIPTEAMYMDQLERDGYHKELTGNGLYLMHKMLNETELSFMRMVSEGKVGDPGSRKVVNAGGDNIQQGPQKEPLMDRFISWLKK